MNLAGAIAAIGPLSSMSGTRVEEGEEQRHVENTVLF